jgi:hypothetical protein
VDSLQQENAVVVKTIRINAPHFNAGVVLHDDVVRRAAPILQYMLRWKRHRVIEYAKKKGWEIEEYTDGQGRNPE